MCLIGITGLCNALFFSEVPTALENYAVNYVDEIAVNMMIVAVIQYSRNSSLFMISFLSVSSPVMRSFAEVHIIQIISNINVTL